MPLACLNMGLLNLSKRWSYTALIAQGLVVAESCSSEHNERRDNVKTGEWIECASHIAAQDNWL